jgi:hypothetical protein
MVALPQFGTDLAHTPKKTWHKMILQNSLAHSKEGIG